MEKALILLGFCILILALIVVYLFCACAKCKQQSPCETFSQDHRHRLIEPMHSEPKTSSDLSSEELSEEVKRFMLHEMEKDTVKLPVASHAVNPTSSSYAQKNKKSTKNYMRPHYNIVRSTIN